jgi:membrane protease subunit (stomatin/prohibitin family)
MSLRVEDFRKLLLKLVGTENFLGQEKLVSFFRSFLMTKVKTYIAQSMRKNSINIFQMDENLTTFSEDIWKMLIPDFLAYGVSLERFFVTNVVKPDGERQYEKFKELHFRQYADVTEAKLNQQIGLINAQTDAQKKVIASQAEATKRMQEGYSYQQERGFDVAERIADNEAVAQFTNLGVGLGTMAGVGGAIGGLVGGTVNNAINAATQTEVPAPAQAKCAKCGAALNPKAKFCMECGSPLSNKCPKCGADVPAGGKFCLECGEKL